MTAETDTGIVFPEVDGRRSTSAVGREVSADALRPVDPVGARAAEQETNWRTGYVGHFRRLVEAGLLSPSAAEAIARDGLASLYRCMQVRCADGSEIGLADLFLAPAPAPEPPALRTHTVVGSGPVQCELVVPYRGQQLRGDALRRQLHAWVAAGIVEPSCAEAVGAVLDHPDWLDLSDVRIVALGAAAEMGPLAAVLRWGGDVVAVDLPQPALWERLLAVVTGTSGRLHVPVRADAAADRPVPEHAGVDVILELPLLARWLETFEERLVLGNYVYADGVTNVRAAVAVDALTAHLQSRRRELALAFLATPTDAFAVPADAVAHADRAYEERSRTARLLGRPLRTATGGRLLRRNYLASADPGLNDSLVPQQGPNYALAKRVQRWRAVTARRSGATVSLNVAPPTRTRSVLRNRLLAAAYAGAHHFGVEVFEPATSSTLMAALLVHDLRVGRRPSVHPWQDEAAGAAHGGLWRCPYHPPSVLGLAAMLGLAAARS